MKTQIYWDNKHPFVDQQYQGRPLPGTKNMIDIDVRHFCWNIDILLKGIIKINNLVGNTHDETALRIQKFVVNYLIYTDDTTMGASEFWLFPNETIARVKGDCEDGAILIASLLLVALPAEEQWRVRVSAGYVQVSATTETGGHGYCTYCRTTDNEWVVLDWCFLQDSGIRVKDKPLQKFNAPYKDVWFSFNHQHAWSHIKFDLKGRVRGNKIKN